jgi:formylglycine-generating enzyme required for sulfatase activity
MNGRIKQAFGVGVLALSGAVIWLAAALAADAPKPAAKADEFKTYKETIPGSAVSFEMVALEGGTYTMGSPATEAGRGPDEGPQHPVTLKPFWMGAKEVTWDEFDQFWHNRAIGQKEDVEPETPKNADAVTHPTAPYSDETWAHGRAGHPVLGITWHAAMQYCRWLSLKTGKVYRLPTEAEWEYAARAGTKTAYFFGDDPKKLGDYAWDTDNSDDGSDQGSKAVGAKKPNPWGLYDIYGNVSEYCLDLYDKDYYSKMSPTMPTLQPVNIPDARRFGHVVRGGSWGDEAVKCRSAARGASAKSWIKLDPQRPQSIWWLTSADFVGFRIVRPVEEQANLKGFRSKITLGSK